MAENAFLTGTPVFRWQVSPSQAFVPGMIAYERRLYGALHRLMATFAQEIEAWMKQNARWQDDSGLARASLWAEVRTLGNDIALAIGHGVWYGLYLETGFAGRYAIITPAMDEFGPRIWAAVLRLMGT